MGVGVLTHASPSVFGANATDAYLTQPVVMGSVLRGPFSLTGALDLEGYTLRRGELNAGIYGEGYVDRRHPHTLVHELMMTATSATLSRVHASLAIGKGFTPYGTDDPMMRPLEKFPVNHHHAQIIERVQVVGAVRVGGAERNATIEHAFFNGDEPVDPFSVPQWKRFGDSRSTRVTLMPSRAIELQASRAFVRSPGIIQGGAFDHTQTDLSVRFARANAMSMGHDMSTGAMSSGDTSMHTMASTSAPRIDPRYLLLEVARTDEGFGARRVFRYNSVLAEGAVGVGRWTVAARAERTERPESERLLDPFRIASGHIDFQIIGITRWTVGTVHVDAPTTSVPKLQSLHATPFVEVSRSVPIALAKPAVFIPRDFYGASMLWTVSAGVRVDMRMFGTMRERMGRYGVLAPTR